MLEFANTVFDSKLKSEAQKYSNKILKEVAVGKIFIGL